MSRLKARCGAGIAELLVALAMSAVVSAAGAMALATTERYMRRARATSDARRMIQEAMAVLEADLRGAASDSVRLRGDTALDFLGVVGVSVVCFAKGTTLVLPSELAAGGNPYTVWRGSPEAGDIVALFDTAAGGRWRTAIVDTAGTRSDGAGCSPSTGLISVADSVARRPVTRVMLQTPLDSAATLVGAPVRIVRSGRYALTRAGDGSWSLSYRRCTPSCGVAQPVAGPFAAPADSGLVFTSIPGESRVDAALRALTVAPGVPAERGVLRLTLRNHATGAP